MYIVVLLIQVLRHAIIVPDKIIWLFSAKSLRLTTVINRAVHSK